MDVAQHILQLICSGASQTDAASTAGCSEGYVSQLMGNPEFKQQVQSARAARTVKYRDMDQLMDSIEEKTLQKLNTVIDSSFKLPELLAVFKIANAAKRRSTIASGEGASGSVTVKIALNSQMREAYGITVDVNNKVVQVGGNTMVPATAATLQRLALERKVQDVQATESVDSDKGRAITVADL